MNKLININDYIKLSTYHEKYGVCKRKLYRHRFDEDIDYINIDGIFFIKDEPSSILQNNNSGRPSTKSVKNVTLKDKNVKNLTLSSKNVGKSSLNDDYLNVKNVTFSNSKNVKNLTLTNRLDELLTIPEDHRTIKQFEEIDEIRNKMK